MRHHSNFPTAALGGVVVSRALLALAGGKHFSRAHRMHGAIVSGPVSVVCNGKYAQPIRPCARNG